MIILGLLSLYKAHHPPSRVNEVYLAAIRDSGECLVALCQWSMSGSPRVSGVCLVAPVSVEYVR